jgi:uncharacterized membrane protein YkoI
MRYWARKIHVVATWIVGAQLVAWAATGFAFTLFDFQVVRGAGDRSPVPALDLPAVRLRPEEAAARALAVEPGSTRVQSVRLKTLDGHAVYEVALADARGELLVAAENGEAVSIDAQVASRIAIGAFRGPVAARSVERRDEDARSAFVVHLDDRRSTEVAVDAATGDITSWRNQTWRAFDTLWSIHVLGYIDRRSPAHWALRIVAFAAAIATFSGAALLLSRLRTRARSRSVKPLEKEDPHGLPRNRCSPPRLDEDPRDERRGRACS